jgi:hypothetical protein
VPRYDQHAAREAIAASTNWSQALRRLGLRAAGGNHRLLKAWAAAWGIPTHHFRPYADVGEHLHRPARPLEDVLVEGSSYSRARLKQRLYAAGLKARACELCGQGEEWRGRRLSLILDHVNGVHDDNRLENLRIVCPNCAATLPTHCSRNLPPRLCLHCDAEYRRRNARQKYCSHACWAASRTARADRPHGRKVPRPSYEELRADLRVMSVSAVGRKHGVSDNAVRKWLRRYERDAQAAA